MNRIIVLICFLSVFLLQVYGLEADFYKSEFIDKRFGVLLDCTAPLCIGDKITVTADDGTKIILKQLTLDYESDNFRWLFDEYLRSKGYRINKTKDTYFRNLTLVGLCESEKHVLFTLDYPKNYFQKMKDFKFKLIKVGDFANVTAYTFISTNKKSSDNYETLIWIDKKEDLYCSSQNLTYYNSIYFGMKNMYKEYYTNLIDLFTYKINDDLSHYENSLDNYEYYDPQTANWFLRGIFESDETVYNELNDRFKMLIEYQEGIEDQLKNQRLLKRYALPVPIAKEYFETYNTEEIKLRSINISGKLPKNKTELKRYISWMEKYIVPVIYEAEDMGDLDVNPFCDFYNTQVKYDLVKGGLKITSAGRDKVFGTDDDQSYIVRYDFNPKDYGDLYSYL